MTKLDVSYSFESEDTGLIGSEAKVYNSQLSNFLSDKKRKLEAAEFSFANKSAVIDVEYKRGLSISMEGSLLRAKVEQSLNERQSKAMAELEKELIEAESVDFPNYGDWMSTRAGKRNDSQSKSVLTVDKPNNKEPIEFKDYLCKKDGLNNGATYTKKKTFGNFNWKDTPAFELNKNQVIVYDDADKKSVRAALKLASELSNGGAKRIVIDGSPQFCALCLEIAKEINVIIVSGLDEPAHAQPDEVISGFGEGLDLTKAPYQESYAQP